MKTKRGKLGSLSSSILRLDSLFLSIKFLIRRSTDNFKLIFLPSYFLAKNIIDDGKIFIPKNSTKFNDNAN